MLLVLQTEQTRNCVTRASVETWNETVTCRQLMLACLPTYTTQQSPSWEANRFSASQEIPRILWNPEGSLPYSQVPAACPCPEPARSSPYPHIPLPEVSLYYYPLYSWFSQLFSFPQVSPPKPCIHLSSPPYVLHAPPLPLFTLCSTELYLLSSTDQEKTVYIYICSNH